jgi:uncharacterized repeat protein (TIGR03803 family)
MNISKVRVAGILSLCACGAMFGCAKAQQSSSYSTVQVVVSGGRTSSAAYAYESQALQPKTSAPADPSGFDCMVLNVTGPGIGSTENIGLVSSMVPVSSGGVMSLQVTQGVSRLFQVVGIMSNVGCPAIFDLTSTANFPLVVEIGRTVSDIFGDTNLTVKDDYDSSTATDLRTGVAVGTGGGGGGGVSSDSTLSMLAISSGTLSPIFSSSTQIYSDTVTNATSSITLTPTVDASGATVTVNGTAVSSGAASGAISLHVGLNTVTTVVTSPSGATETYTTVVDRNLPTGLNQLHSFHQSSGAQSDNDAEDTYGGLTLAPNGHTLYGMAYGLYGLVFKTETDGSSFTDLHDFLDTTSDGANPYGDITVSPDGSTLYGMTSGGGADYDGIVFRMGSDGSAFTILHSFTNTAGDGSNPYGGSLLLSGNTLYGTTEASATGNGVIFKVGIDGSGYTILHTTGNAPAIGYLYGGLTLYNNVLYGAAQYSGAANCGGVYSINPDGSNYQELHVFANSATDACQVFGHLLISGGSIYGASYAGGSAGTGAVFKMNLDGSGVSLLHSFLSNGSGHENGPYGGLSLSFDGTYMIGTTENGGTGNGDGTLYKIGFDGSNYAVLYSFTNTTGDGAQPYYMTPLVIGTTIYGMTYEGGTNDYGLIFGYSY